MDGGDDDLRKGPMTDDKDRALGKGLRVLGHSIREQPVLFTVGVAGSILFGVGWSICGMCPGPILVNIGEGKLYAFAALAGALIGAGAFGTLYTRVQNLFALPPLKVGTGEG